MGAFEDACDVETRGRQILVPYVARVCAKDGRYVLTDGGRFAFELQHTAGDILFNHAKTGDLIALEFKIEERDGYGNFFFELWSNNKPPEFYKQGWLYTSESDWLWYFFLEELVLYKFDFMKLKQWAFEPQPPDSATHGHGRIYAYPLKQQKKRDQPNKTFGACVPIADMVVHTGFCHREQLETT